MNCRTDINLIQHNFHRNLHRVQELVPDNKFQQNQVFEPSGGKIHKDEPFYEIQLNGITLDVAHGMLGIRAFMTGNEYADYKIYKIINGMKFRVPYTPKKRIPKQNESKFGLCLNCK